MLLWCYLNTIEKKKLPKNACHINKITVFDGFFCLYNYKSDHRASVLDSYKENMWFLVEYFATFAFSIESSICYWERMRRKNSNPSI